MNKDNQARVTISLYKRDIEALNFIAQDTGMSKSDVIRQLILKAATDQYNRKIITDNSYNERQKRAWESFQRRQKRLTSYNVQNEKDIDPMTDASCSSSNCQYYDKEIEHLIQVAKAKWIEDEDL